MFVPRCIVSGGQTGVDRAGLEVAIALGLEHGGWCPAGRLSEDGTIPSRYDLRETESDEYPVRTEQNVVDSDATLILYESEVKGGTRLTRNYCRRHQRPHCVALIEPSTVSQVQMWLQQQKPTILNVAGPRESTYPGIFDRALTLMLQILAPRMGN